MTVFNHGRFCTALCTRSLPRELTTQDVSPIVSGPEVNRGLSRRWFLRTTVATTAGTLVGLGAQFCGSTRALHTNHAQSGGSTKTADGWQPALRDWHDDSSQARP